MKRKPGRQISIRIDPDLIDLIDEEARKVDRSRNYLIGVVLKKNFKKEK